MGQIQRRDREETTWVYAIRNLGEGRGTGRRRARTVERRLRHLGIGGTRHREGSLRGSNTHKEFPDVDCSMSRNSLGVDRLIGGEIGGGKEGRIN